MFIRGIAQTAYVVAMLLSTANIVHAESRYVAPFENLRRTHDLTAFGGDLRKAREEPVADMGQDITYLLDVVSSTDNDPAVQVQALQELYMIAFALANYTTEPIEAFRPAIRLFEAHLDEALADPTSKWAWSIVSLTAFVGLQPRPRTIALFRLLVDSKDERVQEIAMVALARLHPRPAEAKQTLISRLDKVHAGVRILVASYALDDPDFLAILTKFLEGTDPDEQRDAIRILAGSGGIAKPALPALRRLQQRKNLDPEVARNVNIAIGNIENARQR